MVELNEFLAISCDYVKNNPKQIPSLKPKISSSITEVTLSHFLTKSKNFN